MAAYQWIKIYHEILDDPKMGRMNDHLWRRTIEIFLIAGKVEKNGILPTVEDMAWTLRTTVDDINTCLDEMEKLGIISKVGDEIIVTHYAERQSTNLTGAERTKRYRENKSLCHGSDADVTEPCHGSDADVTEQSYGCIQQNKIKNKIKNKINNKDLTAIAVVESENSTSVDDFEEKLNNPKTEKIKKEPSDPDYWSFLKEKEPLGIAFYEATRLYPVGKQFGLWVKGFNALSEAGITPEVIPRAVKKMRDEGLTIKSPESILAIAREIMINAGKAKDGTQWTRA